MYAVGLSDKGWAIDGMPEWTIWYDDMLKCSVFAANVTVCSMGVKIIYMLFSKCNLNWLRAQG